MLTQENFFVDELDGKWTLGYNFGNETETLCVFGEEDYWLFPEDLGFDHILNVWYEDNIWKYDLYDLPSNWKDLVTNNKGKDGKLSILDIMFK